MVSAKAANAKNSSKSCRAQSKISETASASQTGPSFPRLETTTDILVRLAKSTKITISRGKLTRQDTRLLPTTISTNITHKFAVEARRVRCQM